MLKRTKLCDRVLPVYSVGEEIANTVTHLVGGLLGILALVLSVLFILSCVLGRYVWKKPYVNEETALS